MSIEQYLSHPRRGVAAEAALGALVARLGGRVLRRRVPPSLRELAGVAARVYGSPRELLLGIPDVERFLANTLSMLAAEYEEAQAELARRYAAGALIFPEIWAVEDGTSFLLYALVRARRPSLLLELGVANGHSTYYMLNALARNGHGRLVSFDIRADVAGLVANTERSRWDFRRVTSRRGRGSLTSHLAELSQADLCFHDADHGYLAQSTEFPQLWDKLRDGGTLVLDDIDASYALVDWSRATARPVHILVDRRKAVGVLTRGRDGSLASAVGFSGEQLAPNVSPGLAS